MDPGSVSGVTMSFSDAVSIVSMFTVARLVKLSSNGVVLDKVLNLKSRSWGNLGATPHFRNLANLTPLLHDAQPAERSLWHLTQGMPIRSIRTNDAARAI
jgi:hypothetical protein